jgi:NADH dehydrogenase FAD-containing subunit
MGNYYSDILKRKSPSSTRKNIIELSKNRKQKFVEYLSPDANEEIMKYFKTFKNGNIIHGERVTEITDKVKLKSSNELDADLVFLCTGNRPNTKSIQQGIPEILDNQGLVNTNEHLQVEGVNHFFVAGDITNIQEQKMYAMGIRHSFLISENIQLLFSKSPMKKYSVIKKGVMLTLGPEKKIFLKFDKVMGSLGDIFGLGSIAESLKLAKLSI